MDDKPTPATHYWYIIVARLGQMMEFGVFSSDTAAKAKVEHAVGYELEWSIYGKTGTWQAKVNNFGQVYLFPRAYDEYNLGLWESLINHVHDKAHDKTLRDIIALEVSQQMEKFGKATVTAIESSRTLEELSPYE